jgi:hypothetical protein
VIEVVGLIGFLLSVTAFDAEPEVVRVSRAAVASRKKMRFMLLSYYGSWGRCGVDRQTTI